MVGKNGNQEAPSREILGFGGKSSFPIKKPTRKSNKICYSGAKFCISSWEISFFLCLHATPSSVGSKGMSFFITVHTYFGGQFSQDLYTVILIPWVPPHMSIWVIYHSILHCAYQLHKGTYRESQGDSQVLLAVFFMLLKYVCSVT